MDFSVFRNKYIITGELEVMTALHIGSGKEEDGKDSPFINVNGELYIPGSSFRGYLRTKLERLLTKENGFIFENKATGEELNEGDVLLLFGYTNLNKEEKDTEEEKRRLMKVERIRKYFKIKDSKEKPADSLAGRIHISDMKHLTIGKTITRDGIKIDRNTGATEKGAKFDYDVIPAGARFSFCMELENVEKYQLELIGLALKDMIEEGDLFGGKLSRGIGKCRLIKDELKMNYIEADNKEDLKEYIFNKTMKVTTAKNIFEVKNLNLK